MPNKSLGKISRKKSSAVFLVLHNVRSIYNVGSIFRIADCAGVSKIYLTGYTPAPVDRFGRKRKDLEKVALGAEKSIDWEFQADVIKLMKKLKAEKTKIVALEQSPRAIDYKKTKLFKEKFALIVGNEVDGIDQKVLKVSEQIIEIPIRGKKESLNVAVATGVALFRILDI